MLQSEIKRESLGVQEFETPVVDMAAEVAHVLGHTKLTEEVGGKFENGPLAKTLVDLGIEILNLKQVNLYRDEHQKDVAKKLFSQWIDTGKGNSWDGKFRMPEWEQHDIAQYKEAIPEFVLNKALQIKKALPETVICIEFLNESPDPFLVVKRQEDVFYGTETDGKRPSYKKDAESYYVEVWNEPKFEGRLR